MSIESTVHRLLEIHQEYSPVELLKAENELTEERHRAWRTGELSSLDEALENALRARAMLESALSFAQELELVPERISYHGVDGHAGRLLVASVEPLLNDLLVHRHRPTERGQGDLFLDGGRVASSNALRDAILARDPGRAREELKRASARIPDYRFQRHAEILIAALEAPKPEDPSQAFESMERMRRHWLPAAHEFLGVRLGARLLEPRWRDIGHALAPVPFNPEDPDRHASYAFLQARAWRDLKRSVQAVPNFRTERVLLARLASAESGLRERIRALECWFALCLLAPDDFADRVESTEFEDPGIARAWQLAMAEGDGGEELTAEWFPAWMLIREPGLARALAGMEGKSPPATAFNLVRKLQRMPPEERRQAGQETIALRGELQRIHPGLLRAYLKRRDVAS